jgi:hypothetical protein
MIVAATTLHDTIGGLGSDVAVAAAERFIAADVNNFG